MGDRRSWRCRVAAEATRWLDRGDLVQIETALPSAQPRRLSLTAVAHDIARGSVAAYYPEANVLFPLDYQDKESGTPSYKSIPVRVQNAA